MANNMQQHLCVTCQVLSSTNSKDTLQADLTMRKGPNVELAVMSGFGHDVCAFAKPQPACAPALLACSKACACSQTCWMCVCCKMRKCFQMILQQGCLQLIHHSSIQTMPWACMTGSMNTIVHLSHSYLPELPLLLLVSCYGCLQHQGTSSLRCVVSKAADVRPFNI